MNPTYPELLRDRDSYRRWYLNEPVSVYLSDNHYLEIPKGYRFDGHSVPWIFRLFFPKYNEKDVYAAMVHDCLIDIEMFHRFNRKFIDNEYKRFMEMPEYSSSRFRRFFMPLAVRVYGFLVWDLFGDNRGTPKPNTELRIDVVV